MIRQFEALKALRDKLASIPAFTVDAETRAAIVKALEDLDDAMVFEIREQNRIMEERARRHVRDTMSSEGIERLLWDLNFTNMAVLS